MQVHSVGFCYQLCGQVADNTADQRAVDMLSSQ